MSILNKKTSIAISAIFIHSFAFADGSFLFCSNENSKWHWATNPIASNGNTPYFWLEGYLKLINAPNSLHSALSLDTNDLLNHRIRRDTSVENKTNINSQVQSISLLELDINAFFNNFNLEMDESYDWEKLENWESWDTYSNETFSRKKRASITKHNNQNSIQVNKIPSKSGLSACSALVNYCVNTFGKSFRFVGAAGNALASTDWGYVVADNLICPNWDYPEGLVTTSQLTVGSLVQEIAVDLLTSGPIKGAAKGGNVPNSLASRPNSLAFSNNGGAGRKVSYADLFKKPSSGIEGKVVQIERINTNPNTPSNEGAISPMDPFGTRLNEITRSASELNMNTSGSERRPSQIADHLVSSSNHNTEGMGARKSSYADMAKAASAEGLNETTNSFQRAGSLRIEMYKIGGNTKPKVPSRAYSHSDLIDFNTAKRFYNNEGRIKDLSPNFELYEMDIPLVEELVRVRDAKRVIVDRITGKRWYSPDHYDNFVDMNKPIDPVKLAEKNKIFLESKL
jgi:hypothetical protein